MGSILERLQGDCKALYTAFGQQGKVPADKLPTVPSPASFSIQQAQQAATSFPVLQSLMGKGVRKTVLPALEERQRKIVTAIGYYEATKAKHDRQVFAALGSAVVAMRAIPAKLTPVIRSITNSIKAEEDVDLQARSANAIAAFIDICSAPDSPVRSNPSDKLVKNLCTFLCQDVSRTPIFAASKGLKKGILTLEYKPARGLATKDSKEASVESEDVVTARLVYRGAQLALSELAARFGPELLNRVPKLWSCMSETLLSVYESGELTGIASEWARADSPRLFKATSSKPMPFSPRMTLAAKTSSTASLCFPRELKSLAAPSTIVSPPSFPRSSSRLEASTRSFVMPSLAVSLPSVMSCPPRDFVTWSRA